MLFWLAARHQPRPALVISADERNRLADDVTVVPILSRGAPGPTRVRLHAGVGGLPCDSTAFCDELTMVGVDFLEQGPLGDSVPDLILREVVRCVRIAVGDVPLPGA